MDFRTSTSRRVFLQQSTTFGALGISALGGCADLASAPDRADETLAQTGGAAEPAIERAPVSSQLRFDGVVGERLAALQHNWLIPLPRVNPTLTEMFVRREQPQPLLPWSGEFAGKYLIGALQVLRITRHPDLDATVRDVAGRLLHAQGTDGYLGPFAPGQRFSQWDSWGHYHCMLGLYEVERYYRPLPSHARLASQALEAVLRAADLLHRHYVLGGRSFGSGSGHDRAQNEAPSHVFALLVRDGRASAARLSNYRAALRHIVDDWRNPQSGSGQYLRDRALHESAQPRWESLPNLQALAESALIGEREHGDAFRRLWQSIHGSPADPQSDLHNHGGFSSRERASGNPYDPRPCETCGTVAWLALCVDKLRLDGTESTRAADAMELATYNAVLGMQRPDGTQFGYDVAMGGIPVDDQPPLALAPPLEGRPSISGERRPTRYDLHWQQAGESTHDLTCCSANGPRGLGCLADWSVMIAPDQVVLNFYGPSRFAVPLGADTVTLTQDTSYPYGSGRIALTVRCTSRRAFTLHLRIPAWATGARVQRGGSSTVAAAGRYLSLSGSWLDEQVLIDLPLVVRTQRGTSSPSDAPGSAAGLASLYRGPLLLAYDERSGPWTVGGRGAEVLPAIAPSSAALASPSALDAELALRFAAVTPAGARVTLCDYASAGSALHARVDEAFLTSRTFQFGRRSDALGRMPAGVIDASWTFAIGGGAPGTRGRVLGSSGALEHSWSLTERGRLRLHGADGRPTTEFRWGALAQGRRVLRGPFADSHVVHELSERDLEVEGKRFQLRRVDDGALLAVLRFERGGVLTGATHPNEATYRREGGDLLLCDAGGEATSRFSGLTFARGRALYHGTSLLTPSRTHQLIECDTGFVDKVFMLSRGDGTVIARRLRLLVRPEGNLVEGLPVDAPNEASWRTDASGQLELLGRDGRVTTRFDRVGADPEAAFYRGTFLLDPRIVHVLTEVDLDWTPGRRTDAAHAQWGSGNGFASWLRVT